MDEKPGITARDKAAFTAGFRAGLEYAERFRAEIRADKEKELASFKAGDPEFYASLRLQMVAAFEAEAQRSSWPANVHASVMAEVTLRDIPPDEQAVLEQLRAARSRELARIRRDLDDVPAFADLIRAGEVNKTAAAQLGIGMERAKRLRSLAVELGLLDSRKT